MAVEEAMTGIISLSSKSTAILTAIMSNSASHFASLGAKMAYGGGRGILFQDASCLS